ncbi:hypothetical protein BV372_31970 [Nostoc sp. T09]|nr:hypothetical protein BV372_31970 [Nostoc sp. T09]
MKWKNIQLEQGWIIFKESFDSSTGITKNAKNNVYKLFKMQGISKLINLLKRLYKSSKKEN